MLYQLRGMRGSSRTNFVWGGSDGGMGTPPGWAGWDRPRPVRDGSLARDATDTQSAPGLVTALRLVDRRLLMLPVLASMLAVVRMGLVVMPVLHLGWLHLGWLRLVATTGLLDGGSFRRPGSRLGRG